MLSKQEVITGFLAIAVTLGVYTYVGSTQPQSDWVTDSQREQVATFEKKYNALTLEEQFDLREHQRLFGSGAIASFIQPDDELTFDIPGMDLTLGPPECVDTFLLDDISCADKAAVMAFRKAQTEALRLRLQQEIDRLEKEFLYKELGMQEA